MSAPGIQLYSSTETKYFEPDVRTYVQKIEQAVVSNNLPVARQAFEQLDKLVSSSTAVGGRAGSSHTAELAHKVAVLGQALTAGDIDTAANALVGLRQTLALPSTESQGGETTAQDDSPDSNGQVSVRI